MADRIGQQLGNYRLTQLLGLGGFAEVYLGKHIHLETEAAIKLLHTYLVGKDKEAFLQEARTIARLVHPNIVRVFDFGIENEAPFLVMDYAPNGTLRSQHPKGVELPLPTIIGYVRQIANALQYAHDEHFIHCDIKPENLLVGRQQEILLSDFGIALIAQTSRSQSMQNVAGTASYMAPEQFQGKPCAASDQYALAIMVYEWLTGRCPFHGAFAAIAGQHLLAPPPPLQRKTSTISLEAEQVVVTALAKDPKQRFGSVIAFATALQQAVDSTSPQERLVTHHPTKAADVSPPTNQISESFIPTEQGTHPHSLLPSVKQVIPHPRPSSISIAIDNTASSQLALRQKMERRATQPLQMGREYQPNIPPSPSPTDLSNQTPYELGPSSPELPIQQAVHKHSPYPLRKYPNFNVIAGAFLLIIVLVSGSLLLAQGNISPGNSTTLTATAVVFSTALTSTAAATPTAEPFIHIGCPEFTLSSPTTNPDGTIGYSSSVQAKDKTGGNCNIAQEKPITADGIIGRIWLVPQDDDPQTDPGTHFLDTATDQLQHPEKLSQPFPQEIENALIFDPATTTQTQPCIQGAAKWKFTISPSVPKGNYYLVALTDWQGKSYNWTWIGIKIESKKQGK